MNSIEKIDVNRQRMSKKELMIADSLLKNADQVTTSNISTLAAKMKVSQASISRFVRKYCAETFMELKIELASRNSEQNSYDESRKIFSWADDVDQIPSKMIQSIDKTCQDVMEVNPHQVFTQAVKAIKDAPHVIFFGVGASGIIVDDFQQKLARLEKRCIYNPDSNFGVLNARLAGPKDVVVAVSFTGRTKEVLVAAREAKARGAVVITMTGNLPNPLEQLADIRFHVPTTEYNSVRLAPIFSIYGQLFIVDNLFLMLAKAKISNVEKFVSQYKDLTEQLKEK